MKYLLVVEGHGEVAAAQNLVTRLWLDLGLDPKAWWAKPIRSKGLTFRLGTHKACELIRRHRDAAGALVLRDEDDACPKDAGPQMSAWVREAQLPFPTAVVLAHREYEVFFLPCLMAMADKPLDHGRPGLRADTRSVRDPEAIRDVKGWLSAHLYRGRSYKPTLDQLPLTRMIDFGVLRKSGLPCFGTLERALTFLASGAPPGSVYPPAGTNS